jgi:glycosyltransferase involved in cell wall biosynthesis
MKTQYKSEYVEVGKYALPVNGLPDVKQYDKLFSHFEAQILAAKPDVVHGNTIQAYHAMAIAARHGIATVWNIRESEEPASHGSDFHEGASLLLKEAIKTVQQYVFVSNSTRGIWEQAFPGIKAAVIQNGIDYNRLTLPYRVGQRPLARAAYGIRQDEIMLLSVGTWTERKGQIDFVDALKKIDCRLWPRIRVVLIGATDTPYGAIIRNSIESAPAALRDRIMVDHETSGLAQRARVLQAYAAADVFVFTSRIESYPRVVSEAMFYGLPIIATPCFGVVEQLEAGVSASFYQPGAIDHLASLLQQLITNAETRLRLSAAAKSAALNKVIQYPEMLERYYEIHSNLVA